MEDTKEKVSKLGSEEETQVAGGYSTQVMKHEKSTDTVDIENLYCDVCRRKQRWNESVKTLVEGVGYRTDWVSKERLLIPFQGGHICVDCLKKVENELGRKIL